MKKIILYSAAIAALFACNKIDEEVIPVNSEGKQIITAYASIPFTKLAYSENTVGGGSGLSSTWETGDTFKAIQKTGDDVTVVTFTLYDGDGTTQGKFRTETEGVTAETQWTAVLGSHSTIQGEEIHCSFRGQNGKLASLDDFNYVVSTGTGTAPTFSFNPGTAKSYIMRVKLPAGIKCIEYTPSAYWKVSSSGVNATLYYSKLFSGGSDTAEITAWTPTYTSVITLDAASSAGDIVYIAVPAINFSHSYASYDGSGGKQFDNRKVGVIITIMNDDSDNATLSNGTVLGADVSGKGGQIGTFDLSGMTLISRPKPSEAIHMTAENVGTNDTSGGKNYMNLTTDNDTYWAPYNVGATTSTEVGDYFAWGEINPKSDYSEGTYSMYENTGSASTYTIISTRLYKNGENILDGSVVDDKGLYTIRGSRYDVARVKWGKAWRMPGVEEAYGLSQGTISTNSTTMTITKDASTVTIPVCGRCEGTSAPGVKSSGWTVSYTAAFWTADQPACKQATAGKDVVQMFANKKKDLSGADFYSSGMYRYYGVPVRAVLATSSVTLK